MATEKVVGDSREAAPTSPVERIDSIDALRGLALFGVLAINLVTEFRVSIFARFLGMPADRGVDRAVNAFLQIAVDLKAFALFSLLFGVGLAIQYDRLRGVPSRLTLLVRRLLALLGFGLVHLCLIWNGDILTEYAIAGFLVLPFLYGPRWLLAAASAAVLSLYVVMQVLPPLVPFPNAWRLADHVWVAQQVYGSGNFIEILAFRIEELRALLPLHVYIFPRTVGLFLLGVLLWRTGVFRNAPQHSGLLWSAALLGIAVGLALTLASSGRSYSGWPSLGRLEIPASAVGTIMLALGYASLVVAIATLRSGRRWLAWAEPLGRMAFTNYILQSLVLGWIFYGYGLGLFGKIGSAAGLALAVALYVVQAIVSRWWLDRFRYGPIEWLWRTLMYGRPPAWRLHGQARSHGKII